MARIHPVIGKKINHEVNGPGRIIANREPDSFNPDGSCTVLHDSGLEQDYTCTSEHPHVKWGKDHKKVD